MRQLDLISLEWLDFINTGLPATLSTPPSAEFYFSSVMLREEMKPALVAGYRSPRTSLSPT